MPLPAVAFSIRQPWAWAITHSFKRVENRDWRDGNPGLRFRGPVLIHAGIKEEKADLEFVIDMIVDQTGDDRASIHDRYLRERHLGGIVGVMEIVDVVTVMDDPWFFGPYGLVIRNARPLPFIACKGALGFFRPAIDFAALAA